MIELRHASMDDADLLLQWRNDPITRRAGHNTLEVGRSEHLAWLEKTTRSESRRLLVAEKDGVPVGTVRLDFHDGECELSWTTAPSQRGKGIAKEMVAKVASGITQAIRAAVKSDNAASERIALHAGMIFVCEKNGLKYFRREAVKA